MPKGKPKHGWPPKGSYPHPAGGHIVHKPVRSGQRIRVVGHLKAQPDTKGLALAIVELTKHLVEQERKKK